MTSNRRRNKLTMEREVETSIGEEKGSGESKETSKDRREGEGAKRERIVETSKESKDVQRVKKG